MTAPRIVGILNLSPDSFSDGGRWSDPGAALAHAEEMVAAGAAIIDVGAESTNPAGIDVPASEQIARLTPVIAGLHMRGVRVSVDAHRPLVIAHAVSMGVEMINDVTALRDAASVAAVREKSCSLVLMHSLSRGARAEPDADAPADIVERVLRFLADRVAALEEMGIARERLILDPGMGLFVGRGPDASLRLLAALPKFREPGLPLYVCPSRKGFIGEVLRDERGSRPVDGRGAGTLAAELWAAFCGVEYIRTHDVRALADGLRMLAAIRAQE